MRFVITTEVTQICSEIRTDQCQLTVEITEMFGFNQHRFSTNQFKTTKCVYF